MLERLQADIKRERGGVFCTASEFHDQQNTVDEELSGCWSPMSPLSPNSRNKAKGGMDVVMDGGRDP